METKRYSSYAQIEYELEILKLEREINLQRMVLSVEKTKEAFLPKNIIKELVGSYKEFVSNSYISILTIAIPLLIKWFSKRKRGD